MLFALYAVYVRLVSGAVAEGFTASLLVMTFLSGVQLFFLGVIGEYLGRVYGETKARPAVRRRADRRRRRWIDTRTPPRTRSLYRKHWWWRVREEIVLARIAALLERVPQARILDVGCGAGLFFDALEQFGEVEGIESDSGAIRYSGKWRDRIHHGYLDAAFTPRAPYDLILMLDVLEHLDDPVLLLRRAATLLGEGGRILITVPAYNWLWTKHDDLNHHVQRFTASGMNRTIEMAGLTTMATSYLFPSLVLPKALVRAVEAVRGGAPAVPQIPPPAVNRAAQIVLRAEHAFAWWLPFGTSVLAIATQPTR